MKLQPVPLKKVNRHEELTSLSFEPLCTACNPRKDVAGEEVHVTIRTSQEFYAPKSGEFSVMKQDSHEAGMMLFTGVLMFSRKS